MGLPLSDGHHKATTPRCCSCHRPIEHCEGEFGEWMHSHDRRERGDFDGHLAYPETAGQVQEGRWGRKKPA